MNPRNVVRAAAERALGGTGAVLLVTGESGLGKTSLLRAFAAELEGSGPPEQHARRLGGEFRVLAGACDDVAEPPRLGPLREAGWPVDLGYQESLARLGESPTALLIDDLQWADDATLDLLGYLARRVAGHPLVVVLTMADDSRLPERLHRWLGGLATAGARRLPLAPLGLDEVRRRVAGSEAEQLYALTGGNPFYLSAMLAAPGSGVPDVIRDAVLAKTARLSDECRSVVEQLAVVPGTIDLTLAEQLTGGDAELLAEAEQYGVLEARHEGIGFRHEIVRLAIEQGIPRLARRALHRRALDVQAQESDRYLARLAHHAIASGEAAAVALYAPRAGQQAAAAGARDEALRMFEAAWKLGVLPAEFAGQYAWELFNAFRFSEAVAAGLPTELHYFADASADRIDPLETLYHELRWDELDRLATPDNLPDQHRLEIIRCLVQLCRGDWAAAEATLAAMRPGAGNYLQARIEPLAARILVRRGATANPQGVPSYAVPALIEQAFLTGDVDRVAALRDEWRELESTPVWPEIHRYCVRAGLEPATGDWASAAQEWARLGDTYEQALELARSGETEPTLEALRLLDELGARPAAELVRRKLRKLGLRVVPRGPAPATRANPIGLTARQADVLELIAEGLTNAEIAEKLVLSVRTVDHHVSAILNRLNVSTRREAAAATACAERTVA
ncbi:LuxR family transcriptional regulator [Streptomyces sp. SID13031]|uniref:AAA family ATPase n=1 Tax=Streptomyces sp. SID13031 TaxID=2706046 RepID=UPI0013CADA9C|nr:LuxR family transcriptional regulator [Streptomyces sp. SID13031]NEA31365.1 hypothetical protein [Streptomyces sp. SID13031]